MARVTVRPMRQEDLNRVADLSGQLGYPVAVHVLQTRFSQIAADPGQALFVAQSNGRLVGWTHVHPHWTLEEEPNAEIVGLVVDEQARRTGAGRALVEEVEGWARQHGFRRIRVRSNVVRQEAHHFYPALGFTRFKTQHNYELRLA